jgi:hypothetical protein
MTGAPTSPTSPWLLAWKLSDRAVAGARRLGDLTRQSQDTIGSR